MAAAHAKRWRSVEVSILRMELDSLVRVTYLNHHCDGVQRAAYTRYNVSIHGVP